MSKLQKILFFIFFLFSSLFFFSPGKVLADYPSYTDGSLLWSHLQDNPQSMIDDIFNEYKKANCTNVKWGAFRIGDMYSYFSYHTGPVDVLFAFGTNPSTCEDISDYDILLDRYTYSGNNFLQLYHYNTVRFKDSTNSFAKVSTYQWASLDPSLPVVGNYVGTLSVYTRSSFPTTPFGSTYGNLGTISGSVLIAPATLDETSLPIAGPPRPAPYRLRLRLEQVAMHEVVYSTDNKCVVNMNAEGSKKPLQCGTGGDEGVIYYSYGGRSLYYGDIHLWITDMDNPCSNLIGSNYTLYDTEGNKVCSRRGSAHVADYGVGFTPPVTFDPEAHDWGAFNWFKTVVSFFADMINGVAEWFFNLWHGFLELIIPEEGFFSERYSEVYTAFQEKINLENLKSMIDNLKQSFDSDITNTFDNTTVVWRGQTVSLIDFKIIKDHIETIRPILQAVTWLSMVFLSVDLIVKFTRI